MEDETCKLIWFKGKMVPDELLVPQDLSNTSREKEGEVEREEEIDDDEYEIDTDSVLLQFQVSII